VISDIQNLNILKAPKVEKEPVKTEKESVKVEKMDPVVDVPDLDDDKDDVTEETGKEHLNIIFIGHVDAGKSTMGGHIL
jgi:peptide chain release factor subunit 3